MKATEFTLNELDSAGRFDTQDSLESTVLLVRVRDLKIQTIVWRQTN